MDKFQCKFYANSDKTSATVGNIKELAKVIYEFYDKEFRNIRANRLSPQDISDLGKRIAAIEASAQERQASVMTTSQFSELLKKSTLFSNLDTRVSEMIASPTHDRCNSLIKNSTQFSELLKESSQFSSLDKRISEIEALAQDRYNFVNTNSNPSELSELLKKVSTLQTTTNLIENIKTQLNMNTEKLEVIIEKIKDKVEKEKLQNFETLINKKLEKLEEKLTTSVAICDDDHKAHDKVIAELQAKIRTLEAKDAFYSYPNSPRIESPDENAQIAIEDVSHEQVRYAKVNVLEHLSALSHTHLIKEFDGRDESNFELWVRKVKDILDAHIPELEDKQKIAKLRALMEGIAREKFEEITISATTKFDDVIKELKPKFQNKESCSLALAKLSMLEKRQPYEDLQLFIDRLEKVVRQATMGQATDAVQKKAVRRIFIET